MTNIVEKINNYYKPEFHKITFTLTANNKTRHINIRGSNKIILAFGYPAKDEKDALKNGGYLTTEKELFKLLFPKEFEELKHKIEPDNRTKKYLDVIKNNIGYIKSDADHDEVEIDVMYEYKIWINVSTVNIGQDINDNWIAQYSLRTAIDDYIIIKHYFNKKPSVKNIKTAELLIDINGHFNKIGWDKNIFRCWECGIEHHWLDCPGDLNEKWNNFKEKYCGC